MPSDPRLPELEQLNAIRLDRDWSIPKLAAAMGKAGYPVSARTLHYLLTGIGTHQPYDRTLHKIRNYLARNAQHQLSPASRRALPSINTRG
jgi:hypothetical protein